VTQDDGWDAKPGYQPIVDSDKLPKPPNEIRQRALAQKMISRYVLSVTLMNELTAQMNSTKDGVVAGKLNNSLNTLAKFIQELDTVILCAIGDTEELAAYIKIKEDLYI